MINRSTVLLCVALGLALARAAGQLPSQLNLSNTTPSAPTGTRNVQWQHDSANPAVNVAGYVIYPTLQVSCPTSGDLSAPIASCLAALSPTAGGVCDARACTAASAWSTAVTLTAPSTVLDLPCATLTATSTLTVEPGTRNVTIHGCAYQGGSNASGTAGGTVWNYTGSATAWQIGDPTLSADTDGFSADNLALVTASAGSAATGITLDRTQEVRLSNLYLIGNTGTGQTGISVNGTGNYAGGYFDSLHIVSFGTAVTLTGNSSGAANASTFARLHIDCPTSAGSPIAGTVGINLAYGDGNDFTGGDVEGCATMLSFGAGATDNTVTGLRNENSDTQINALSGSSYNLFISGGTLFTGSLSDAGTHNSFADTFHRSWNNLNGDIWRSQADSTITNHIDTGIGLGNVRGRQDEWVTDIPGTPGSYQNAWLWGPGDGTTGTQTWVLQDLINNTQRLSIGQVTTAGGNNQTGLASAGTGAIILNGSANAGTGGVVFDSGGSSPSQVGLIDNSGDQAWNGTTEYSVGGTIEWELEGASTSNFIIRCPNCSTPADSFIAYNNGGTEIDSQGTAAVVLNNHTFGGTGGLLVYGGGSSYYNTKLFSVTETSGTGVYDLPGIAATNPNHYCVQVDDSGYLSNTGSACGTGSGSYLPLAGGTLTGTLAFSTAAVGQATATNIAQAGGGLNPIPGLLNDSSTDNSSAISTALASGGKWVLPNANQGQLGTIDITSPIVITASATRNLGPELLGSGWAPDSTWGSTIKQVTANTNGIQAVCPTADSVCTPTGTFDDFTLTGPSSGSSAVGFLVTNSKGSGGTYSGGFDGDFLRMKNVFITGFAQPMLLLGVANYSIDQLEVRDTTATTGFAIDIGSSEGNSGEIKQLAGGCQGNEAGFIRFAAGRGIHAHIGDINGCTGNLVQIGDYSGTCPGTSITPCNATAGAEVWIGDYENQKGPHVYCDELSICIVHWSGDDAGNSYLGPAFVAGLYSRLTILGPNYQQQVGVPALGTITQSTGACTLGAQEYYYKYTENNSAYLGTTAAYTTNPSAEANSTFASGSTNCATVPLPALVAGATSFNIYRGTASGAEGLIATGVTGSSYVDTGSASPGAAPPAVGNLPLVLELDDTSHTYVHIACTIAYAAAYGSLLQFSNGEYVDACATANERIAVGTSLVPLALPNGLYSRATLEAGLASSGVAGSDFLTFCGGTYGGSGNTTYTAACSGNLLTATIGLLSGVPTYTAGTNVTSCAQTSGYTNSNTAGELTIVGGTATTGTICTVNWTATLPAAPYRCEVSQNGGATNFGLGHGTATNTALTITAGVTVSGQTVNVDYLCGY